MNVVSVEEGDFNFHKVWFKNFDKSLAFIDNKKLRLALFLIENMDYENKICLTQRQMAEETGMSVDTVSKAVKALRNGNLLVKINYGAYLVNPNIIFKGKIKKRMMVLSDYQRLKALEKTI